MSETSLRIKLSELTTIRLHCTNCKAIVEFAADRLTGPQPIRCPFCDVEWITNDNKSLYDLGNAMKRVLQMKSPSLEFIIPQPPAKESA